MQQPSLAVVPSTSGASHISHASSSTLNAQGLHDTLTYGPRSVAAEVAPKHPLEQRLSQWTETQDTLKFTLQRQLYGVHMPVRQLMERSIVGQVRNPHMPVRGAISNLHIDILTGNDELLQTNNLFLPEEQALPLDIHREMERKLKM
ncbi:MAG: hypothetical protein CYPHOPRED_005414 [Cyphobasidiales sp. Tagirdzhanova-0007]|nr:MAG: hypothetical protein CYPHOPRED_005414 [Cyphobasidiales sp. Tagirdzhanova-0007]